MPTARARPPASSKTAGITTIGVCFLHAYANDTHERAMLDVIREEHPGAVVSISSEVLRETASTSAGSPLSSTPR